MIITKAEAEKLWCPMVNVSVGNDKSGMIISNRSIVSRHCLADGCMMWVWSGEDHIDEQGCVQKGSCGLIK